VTAERTNSCNGYRPSQLDTCGFDRDVDPEPAGDSFPAGYSNGAGVLSGHWWQCMAERDERRAPACVARRVRADAEDRAATRCR
jgi:hypothetical protein